MGDCTVTFAMLQMRLIAKIRERVHSGDLTERSLGRLTGVSQPHIHNVLKGARILSLEMADQILRQLDISLVDLLDPSVPGHCAALQALEMRSYREVPFLEGQLGPGHSFPRDVSRWEHHLFSASLLALVRNPAVARVAPDLRMRNLFCANDLVLLDRSEYKRAHPDTAGYYAIDSNREGSVRSVRIEAGQLHLMMASTPAGDTPLLDDLPGRDYISLADRNILEVIQAKVIWIGRNMEQPPSATEPTQETG